MSLSPAMASKIELWTIDPLIPYAHNARTHSDDQIARIAASMLKFGVNNPILVDKEGGIVAGHGRLLAALKIGLERVPVVVLNHLTPAQRRAYVIADNRLAELAGWDTELLSSELAELVEDIDLSAMGFTDAEFQELSGTLDVGSDDVSTPDNVETSSLAALSFTSPPYGNQRDYTAGIKDWESLMHGVYVKWATLCTRMGKFW